MPNGRQTFKRQALMTKYEKGRKGETRARIIDLASTRFRADGLDGVGIASTRQVGRGASLVGETGTALGTTVAEITVANLMMDAIAGGASMQASNLCRIDVRPRSMACRIGLFRLHDGSRNPVTGPVALAA